MTSDPHPSPVPILHPLTSRYVETTLVDADGLARLGLGAFADEDAEDAVLFESVCVCV